MTTKARVVVFSTPTCTFCNKAKSYLKQQKIRFKDVDVSRDHKAMQDMQKRTGGNKGVPVILVNNRPIIGFDKNKLNRLLNIRN